jgi:hypothetical protein
MISSHLMTANTKPWAGDAYDYFWEVDHQQELDKANAANSAPWFAPMGANRGTSLCPKCSKPVCVIHATTRGINLLVDQLFMQVTDILKEDCILKISPLNYSIRQCCRDIILSEYKDRRISNFFTDSPSGFLQESQAKNIENEIDMLVTFSQTGWQKDLEEHGVYISE